MHNGVWREFGLRMSHRNTREAYTIFAQLMLGQRVGIMFANRESMDKHNTLIRLVSELMSPAMEKWLGIERIHHSKYSISWTNGAKVQCIEPSMFPREKREPVTIWYDEIDSVE